MELFTEQKAKRKLIKVPAEDFIRLTLLDVVHDAGFLEITKESVSLCAMPYANWIYANNPGKFTSVWQVATAVNGTMNKYMGRKADDVKREIAKAYLANTTEVKPESISIVVDSCKRGVFYCNNKQAYATLTQSTYYDRGSFNETCSSARKFVRVSQQDYVFHDKSLNAALLASDKFDPRDYATVLSCKNKPGAPALDVRDLYIVGVLCGVSCVLAFRGSYVSKISPKETAIVFYQRTQPKWISARGWSASAACTSAMMTAWEKIDLYGRLTRVNQMAAKATGQDAERLHARAAELRTAIETPETHWDACRLWAEVAAKQWGDLGLAVDAAGESNWFVATNDKVLQSFCILLGAAVVLPESPTIYRQSKLSVTFASGTEGPNAVYGSGFHDLDSLAFSKKA
jgi:hypothetical protein